MARPSGIVFLSLLTLFVVSFAPGCRPAPAQTLCTIPVSQVLRIPVSQLDTKADNKPQPGGSGSLLVTAGATDEPPEGPQGLDVLDDGVLLITDPLRNEISTFDASGKFRTAWKVGFPADSITVTEKQVVLIRDGITGQLHAYDRTGRARPELEFSLPERMQALVSRAQNTGTVMRPPGNGGSLEIQLARPGLTLLSVEGLGSDSKGDTYVAIEATSGSSRAEEVNVNKFVRRYSSGNKLLSETANLPLDYYVAPVDELRVHNGVVYQLQTTGSEVRVNKWDTNPLCSSSAH